MSPLRPTPLLDKVNWPRDLRMLAPDQLPQLADELRTFVIDTVAKTGGHFASGLGAVELTVALHYVFDTPNDLLVWDVGHQTYPHKVLTGRRDRLKTIRQAGGLSGFTNRSESEYDVFGAAHASTAISAALGMAIARDLRSEKKEVVAIVGDGGLTGGVAMEGLNQAGYLKSRLLVILNDNNMSISPTVGALSRHLTDIITHPLYARIKKDVWEFTEKLPKTNTVREIVRRVEGSLKTLLTPGLFFESLGFRYLGPIDGHDVRVLVTVFEKVREMRGPVLAARADPEGPRSRRCRGGPAALSRDRADDPRQRQDGVEDRGPSATRGSSARRSSTSPGNDPQLVAITAAMADGHGARALRAALPGALLRCGHCRGARGHLRRRPRDAGHAPRRRDLLDLSAAGIRSARARCRATAAAGHLRARSRGARR